MTKTERINLKAKELVDKFYMGDDFPVECGTYCEGGTPNYQGIAKQCALICVDEQLKTLSNIDTSFSDDVAEEVYQAECELKLIKERIEF